MDLTPIEFAALAQAGKELGAVRDKLEPGKSIKVEMTVQISGFISVGEPQNRQTKKAPDMTDLLSRVLAEAESILPGSAAILVKRAAENFKGAEPSLDVCSKAAEMIRTLTTYTNSQSAGPITGHVRAEKIELVSQGAGRKFSHG